jgi:hypothetical protein
MDEMWIRCGSAPFVECLTPSLCSPLLLFLGHRQFPRQWCSLFCSLVAYPTPSSNRAVRPRSATTVPYVSSWTMFSPWSTFHLGLQPAVSIPLPPGLSFPQFCHQLRVFISSDGGLPAVTPTAVRSPRLPLSSGCMVAVQHSVEEFNASSRRLFETWSIIRSL